LNHQQKISDRLAAIELLAYQPSDQAATAYDQLLSARQPVDVQLAAIDAMRRNGGDRAGQIVLDHWASLGPNVRGPALDLLLRRAETTRQMLAAMSSGKVNPAVIGIDQRVRLLRHGDEAIREQATKLYGGAISANRREVAKQYLPAIAMKASVAAGSEVFKRTCIKCHKMDGQGFEVGPDISDVRNRSREALLYDILDPNRKLEPQFTDYLVMTDDGRIFNGLMVAETAETVILRQAEGKQQIIPRAEIEQIRASGKSLMPEGVEKDVSVQQMADLIEYLKSTQRQVISPPIPE
jgi:putative heme-binding domain-containing protein